MTIATPHLDRVQRYDCHADAEIEHVMTAVADGGWIDIDDVCAAFELDLAAAVAAARLEMSGELRALAFDLAASMTDQERDDVGYSNATHWAQNAINKLADRIAAIAAQQPAPEPKPNM